MKIAQIIDSNSWGPVTPDAFKRGIGGREGALVRLATEWAAMGHEVTNFVGVQKSSKFRGEWNRDGTPPLFSGFHEYVPFGLAKPMLRNFDYDAVVAWECPNIFDDDIAERQKVRLVHMQVAHLAQQAEAEKYATGVVALSEWAKGFLVADGLNMPDSKLFVRPNGVDTKAYWSPAMKKNHKKKFSMVYSSSPDRGLLHLLEMWPQIYKEYKALLYVAYGATRYTEGVKWLHTRVGEMALDIELLLNQPGVVDVGKIGQDDLAKLQLRSSFWFYPCDSIQATETGCITAIENLAAGNVCVMSDADCLEDEFDSVAKIAPLPFEANDYVESIDQYNSLTKDEQREVITSGLDFARNRDWSNIAPTWISLFREQNEES